MANPVTVEKFGVGQSVRRIEDPRLLQGFGRYADDVNLPHQAYAVVVRSPHAHAAIRAIDTAAARAAAGVLGVFTGADLAADGLGDLPTDKTRKRRDGAPAFATPRPLLARARVCLVPYRVNAFTDTLVPVKLLEYLAAGRPVVSTPMRAAEGLADIVSFADGAEAFAHAVREADRGDSPEERRRRVERARPYSWERRIDELEAAIEEAANG